MTDVREATKVFEEAFERAGKPNMATRYKKAEEYYNQFKAYEQGTPYVPSDQIALLHEGEMVVPANFNPNNGGKVFNSDGATTEDIQELISVVKQLGTYLAKVIQQNQPVVKTTTVKLDKYKDQFNNSVLGGY